MEALAHRPTVRVSDQNHKTGRVGQPQPTGSQATDATLHEKQLTHVTPRTARTAWAAHTHKA
jgi:hypothetical protein